MTVRSIRCEMIRSCRPASDATAHRSAVCQGPGDSRRGNADTARQLLRQGEGESGKRSQQSADRLCANIAPVMPVGGARCYRISDASRAEWLNADCSQDLQTLSRCTNNCARPPPTQLAEMAAVAFSPRRQHPDAPVKTPFVRSTDAAGWHSSVRGARGSLKDL